MDHPRPDVVVDRDVVVPMRDGTRLRADIYRPASGGPSPAAVTRTPYGKDRTRVAGVIDPVLAAAAGLIVVSQDTRGQGASEGRPFYPFRDDFDDGYDTVEWVAAQTFCSGGVGLFGVSYGGNAAWQAAVANPPALGAIAPTMSPIDWTEGWELLTRGGILKWGLLLAWTVDSILESQVRRHGGTATELASRLTELSDLMDDFDALARTTPMTRVVDTLREVVGAAPADRDQPLDYFDDVVRRRPVPDWADRDDLVRRHSQVTVPVNLTAGWYDVILGHDLEHLARMRADSPAGDRARITIGPWSHSNFTNLVGQLDFGRRATATSLDLGPSLSSELTDWFLETLAPTGEPTEHPPVRAFLQGANRWISVSSWPPPSMALQSWFLDGGGVIGPEMPSDPGRSSFVYDPHDPCPTCGGDLVKPPRYIPGPVDQSPILDRRDVVCFRGPVLDRPLTLLGPVRAVLHTATTGRGTDWVVKLCDEHTDGRVYNVCDGITRVPADPTTEVVEVEIDLWATGIVVGAGHRICVIITSSDFPRYDRNPNTGVPPWEADHFEPALQTVFYSPDRPSRLELPVLPSGALT